MKRNTIPLILFNAFFAVMIASCQKNRSEEAINAISKQLTIEDAKFYHLRLESKYGNYDLIKTPTGTDTSFKQVDFSHAYIGENETSFFVEVPISYTKREILLGANSGISTSTLNEMFSNSFDRLVICKDKMSGRVSDKIVTFIPSVQYLNEGHKDLYSNHYQSMVNNFSGYVTYKNWKGKFASSHSYNPDIAGSAKELTSKGGNTQAKSPPSGYTDIVCNSEEIYRAIKKCDFDDQGMEINCELLMYNYEATICDLVSLPFHDHSALLPNSSSPYWQGWPDAQYIPSDASCQTAPRYYESPITYAALALNDPYVSVSFYGGCFCQGYSWIVLEDVATGTEYSIPIENQTFALPDCSTFWETHAVIPANIPNGQYFIKVWVDGDVFYHQFELDGVIVRRFRHTLAR